MALSNMLREPRRETIESTVGIVVILGLIFGGIYFGWLFQHNFGGSGTYSDIVIGTAIVIIISFVLFLLILFTHFLGEKICNKLENNDIYLRPMRRY